MAPKTPPTTETSSFGATSTPKTELKHSKSRQYIDRTPQRSTTPQRVLKLRTPPSSHHHKAIEENVSNLTKYIGSARKTRHKIESLANLVDPDYEELLAEPNILARNMSPKPATTGLGINDTESLASLDLHIQEPQTPDQKIQKGTTQTPPPLMVFLNEKSHEEETKIRRAVLENPFLDTGSSSMKLVNPFIDSPFNKSERLSRSNRNGNSRQVDYSTTMEFYDKRTGKYIEKEVLEEAKKFKPQRLTFTEEKQQNNNYLVNEMANGMTVDFHKKKKHLGFQIFEDGEHRQ